MERSRPPGPDHGITGTSPGPLHPPAELVCRVRRTHSAAYRRRRLVGRVLLGVGVLVLLFAGWVGWRTYQAYRALSDAANQVTQLQGSIRGVADIDVPSARASVAVLQDSSSDAVSATSDPFYRAATVLPWVGPNLSAIQGIAQTVDGLSHTTAPALLEAATTVTPAAMVPVNGAIPVAPLVAASNDLQAADREVSTALTRMTGIDRSGLVGPVAQAVGQLQDKLTDLQGTTGPAARIARLAPAMLGADGARSYLVVFQNLAEPRATGGIFGSYARLVVDHGAISVAEQGASSRTLPEFDPPLSLPPIVSRTLYGDLPGRYPTDVNLMPDFPTAAQLFARMYAERKGAAVDGVLAIDPVALGYMLQGADPIDIGRGQQLTSSTITEILLSRVYQLFPEPSDAQARDSFLSAATAKAFEAVTRSPNDASAELRGLTRASAEGRLLLWSAHPAEQQDLAATEISGQLGDDSAGPTVGVFRNDATGAKLGFYASGSATLAAGACQGADRVLQLSVPMSSSAPSSGLSDYVLGLAKAGDYVLRTNVLVVAPLGAGLGQVQVDGRAVPVARTTQDGRAVAMVTVELPPGSSATLTATLTLRVAPGTTAAPRVLLTPGIQTWRTTVQPAESCG
ncbi:DUF4012 domain-containing protein [Nakamurella endophytica]|uniref:DUF4012 domain-containing protein n=1 Tax=Nakamurella endophytica TaxID=1748367 RepID=UPI0016686100|nr:DUF4012 domain-containing protein [Nakamurella endophytica]